MIEFAIDLGEWMASGAARLQMSLVFESDPRLPSNGWVDHEGPRVPEAELFFVAPTMVAMLERTAAGFPTEAHAPRPVAPHGLLVLAQPVQLWSNAEDRLCGVYWHGGAFTMLLAYPPDLTRIVTISPKIRLDSDPDERGDWPEPTRGAWNVIASVHSLLAQKYACATTATFDRADRRRLQRLAIDDPINVRIVDYRRRESSGTGANGTSAINWASRWVVSGHWRSQYMPSTGRHEARFIEAFVKGPAHLPLIVRPTVNVWRR